MIHEDIRRALERFNMIFKASDEAYRAAAHRFNMPECALWILYSLLIADGPLTQKDLCERMLQPKQSINTALKKLEQDGCVALTASGSDRRSKLVGLTEKGRVLAESTAGRIVAAEMRVFGRMEPSERGAFITLYEKYTGLLREEMQRMDGE